MAVNHLRAKAIVLCLNVLALVRLRLRRLWSRRADRLRSAIVRQLAVRSTDWPEFRVRHHRQQVAAPRCQLVGTGLGVYDWALRCGCAAISSADRTYREIRIGY